MSNKRKTEVLQRGFKLLAELIPGDHIHYVAPVSRQSQSSMDRVDQIDAAERKRNRKNRRRVKGVRHD